MRNFLVSRFFAPCWGAALLFAGCDGGPAGSAEATPVAQDAPAPPSSPAVDVRTADPEPPAVEPAAAETAMAVDEPGEEPGEEGDAPAAAPADSPAAPADTAEPAAKTPPVKTTAKNGKKAATAPADDAAKEEKPDAEASSAPSGPTAAKPNGKEIYGKKCKNCHGDDGKAETKLGLKHEIESWKEPGWSSKWTLAKIEDIVRDGKDGTKMKPFKDKLTAEEITAVSKYARSLGS